jgi:hypothetical protein
LEEIYQNVEAHTDNWYNQVMAFFGNKEGAPMPGYFIFPHSPKEFPTVHDLQRYLLCELPAPPRRGAYHVAHAQKYEPVTPGSFVLFHKNRKFFGRAKVKIGIKPYRGSEKSPVTGKPYEGTLTFDPDTIRLLDEPAPFAEVEEASTMTFTWRNVQEISLAAYEAAIGRK